MTTQTCSCTTGIKDMGTPNCTKSMGRPHKIVFVELKDSTGAYNKIASADVLNQTYIDGKIQNTDETVRWHVSPPVKEFLSTKEDAQYKEYDDSSRERIRDGKRSYEGVFKYGDPVFLGFLESNRCAKAGFYIVTDQNVIHGYCKDDSGDTYPIPVETLDGVFNYRSGDDIQNVNFMIDIPILIKDNMLSAIYGAEGDLTGMEGLVQLSATLDNATASGYDITIGGAGQFGYTDAYEALVLADLTAYDETNDASQVITSVTATATPGVYTIVFTAPTASATISLVPASSLLSAGFSFDKVELAIL